MKKKVNVAVIGTKFMGKAHSNAWLTAPKFFDLPYTPVLKTICARDLEATKSFAANWGYEDVENDWRKVMERKDIDIVDICTPTINHHEMVVAAAEAGKQILCEKPCALSYAQAKEMAETADKAGVLHYLNHNYRRIPAVGFAKQLIEEGKIGDIYHWRGAYLQDWIIDPDFPFTWQLDEKSAGAGPHFCLNSHAVDLSHFLIGGIESVYAMMKTFIKNRPIDFGSSQTKTVTVDDASFMVAEFKNGAMGSFDTSRITAGRRNHNYFEVYGSKGSILFDLEKMNELEYFDSEEASDRQGFRTIQVTDGQHPYISGWWPPGHIIGYEHTFTHAIKDFICAMAKGDKIYPDLWDGVRIMQVLEAGLKSNDESRKVRVDEIR